MGGAHGLLGWLAAWAAMAVVIAAGAAHLTWGRPVWRGLALLADVLVVLVTVLVFAALFLGGLLLITGLQPDQPLHVFLGMAALATLPAAMAIGIWRDRGTGRSRQRDAWLMGGGVLLALLALLLVQSG